MLRQPSIYMRTLLAVTSSLVVCACGALKGSKGESISPETTSGERDDLLQSFQVSDLGKLPECSVKREGALVYVKATGEFRSCESGEWKVIEVGLVSKSTENQKCTIGRNGLMASINCGTESVTIQDGLAADGAACTVSKTSSVATITCGSSSVTISDGANGAVGSQGLPGSAGTGCSVVKASGIATVVCGSQSVQIVDGVAGQSCSVSKIGSVATITCGTQVVNISDGSQGPQGPAGSDAPWPKITDANGVVIGTMIMSNIDYYIGVMTLDGKFFNLRPDGKWGGVLSTYDDTSYSGATSRFAAVQSVLFTTTDCTGNPHVSATYKVIQNGLIATASGMKISNGNEQIISITAASYFNGECVSMTPNTYSVRQYPSSYTPQFSWPIAGPVKIIRGN